MEIEKRHRCPICKSSQIADWVEQAIPKSSIKFQMFQCGKCHSWYMTSLPDQTTVSAYYTGDYYFFHRDVDFEFYRSYQLYRRTVRLIEGDIPVKKILEIGSSKGYLLAILKSLGWQVHGVEISEEAASYARTTYRISVDFSSGCPGACA
jgi:hypothetical protein